MKSYKKSRFFRKLLLLVILQFLIIGTVYGYGGGRIFEPPKVKNALESSAQIWNEIPKVLTIKMNKEVLK